MKFKIPVISKCYLKMRRLGSSEILNGVQRAGGSNPLAPTNETKGVANFWFILFSFAQTSVSIHK